MDADEGIAYFDENTQGPMMSATGIAYYDEDGAVIWRAPQR